MTVRLGINPIGWTNDCLHWLGDFISLDQCLSEAKQAGFSGVELGRKFPRQAGKLGPILKKHGLSLVSGWYSAELLRRDSKTEIAAMKDHLTLLSALKSNVMVFAETTGEIILNAAAAASSRPKLNTAAEWKQLGQRFTECANHMQDKGVRMAVHHHMGTVVESAEDIDHLMASTGPSVGLLLDTGHAVFAGADPVALAKKYIGRIVHVHCKDIRKDMLAKARQENLSFLNAVLQGTFTVPGDGMIDYLPVLSVLARANYSGWLVVEAEQDPAKAHPLTYAKLGYRNLHDLAVKAGLLQEKKRA